MCLGSAGGSGRLATHLLGLLSPTPCYRPPLAKRPKGIVAKVRVLACVCSTASRVKRAGLAADHVVGLFPPSS
jgi:hypothetical protein